MNIKRYSLIFICLAFCFVLTSNLACVETSSMSPIEQEEEQVRQRASEYIKVIENIINGTGDRTENAHLYAQYRYPPVSSQTGWDSIYSYIDSCEPYHGVIERIYSSVNYVMVDDTMQHAQVVVTKITKRIGQPTEDSPIGKLDSSSFILIWFKTNGQWYYDLRASVEAQEST